MGSLGTEEEEGLRGLGATVGPQGGRGGKRGAVCVTGGTGFIASSLIRSLLQRGYTVRATVRNPRDEKRTAFLWELEGAKERLSIMGADLMEEGSFDAAMEGVEGVFHTAGPVFPPDLQGDPEVFMVDTCVKGTLNVLRSCAKSSTLQRVVMTSSCSAIRYDYNRTVDDPPLDELSWSNADYCRDHQMWYALAKTQAERAAWKFARQHNVHLVVVCPSYVVGPFLPAFPTSTVAYLLYLLRGNTQEYRDQIIGFVHIDDVVASHILVYENPKPRGRYICSSFVAHWQQIFSMIQSKYPTLKVPTRRSGDSGEAIHHTISTSKIQRLGLTAFKGADSMFDDCIQDFVCKGLLPELA